MSDSQVVHYSRLGTEYFSPDSDKSFCIDKVGEREARALRRAFGVSQLSTPRFDVRFADPRLPNTRCAVSKEVGCNILLRLECPQFLDDISKV